MKRTILIILFFLSLCSATAKTDDNRDRLIENLSRMSVQELMKHASEQTDNRTTTRRSYITPRYSTRMPPPTTMR